jgi:serine/threonine protein phosphatase PrpC
MSRTLPRFDFRIDFASESVVGLVRSKNQDAILLAPEIGLFAIADGMGGLDAGERASRLALEVVADEFRGKSSVRSIRAYAEQPSLENRRKVFAALHRACSSAHERLVVEQRDQNLRMGTTLDVCLFVRDKAFVAHVGDGRVLLVRSRAMLQVTSDHVQFSAAPGKGARRGPNPLSSGLGLPSPLRVDVVYVDVRRGDLLVLASDGAYGPFEDEGELATACRGTPSAVVAEIVKTSIDRGGLDNASVIALRVEERFLARTSSESDESDVLEGLAHCPLFEGLPPTAVLAALSAGIEIELPAGTTLASVDAGDHCAYVVLDGAVREQDAVVLGAPALVFAESLVGVDHPGRITVQTEAPTRCLRIRRDDFREVCAHDPLLGAALYERLATHLARRRS